MKTIKSVYKIGNGPSSSHTVGPYHAAQIFGKDIRTQIPMRSHYMDRWLLPERDTGREKLYWKDCPGQRSFLTGRQGIFPIPIQ